MPIKKDAAGKRWVEMDLLVPGTPEQVWQAMATGGGNSAWFTNTEIDERVGGAVKFDFGPNGNSTGEVTIWEPPYRFGYVEREWREGAPPVATEITITSRSGGKCVVRMVHSLFASTDDWDDQVEGFESGWPGFFKVLRIYLTYFPGLSASSFLAMTSIEREQLPAWKQLVDRLGLTSANVGEHREHLLGPEPSSGVVEHVYQDDKQRYLLLRIESPSPGVALIGTYDAGKTTNVSLCRYYYGEKAQELVTNGAPQWRDWLEKSCR